MLSGWDVSAFFFDVLFKKDDENQKSLYIFLGYKNGNERSSAYLDERQRFQILI